MNIWQYLLEDSPLKSVPFNFEFSSRPRSDDGLPQRCRDYRLDRYSLLYSGCTKCTALFWQTVRPTHPTPGRWRRTIPCRRRVILRGWSLIMEDRNTHKPPTTICTPIIETLWWVCLTCVFNFSLLLSRTIALVKTENWARYLERMSWTVFLISSLLYCHVYCTSWYENGYLHKVQDNSMCWRAISKMDQSRIPWWYFIPKKVSTYLKVAELG